MAAAIRTDRPETRDRTDRTDARMRCLELARRRDYYGAGLARTLAIRLDAQGELVSLAVRVPSASSERAYVVTYTARDDRASCDCRAAQFGSPCWHAGCGLAAGRYVAWLYSPAGRAETDGEARLAAAYASVR